MKLTSTNPADNYAPIGSVTISTPTDLEQRVRALEERNKRVEQDKAWETSLLRKVSIIIVTYLVVLGFLFIIKNNQPFVNAIVPSLGFVLSTMAVNSLKQHWLNRRRT